MEKQRGFGGEFSSKRLHPFSIARMSAPNGSGQADLEGGVSTKKQAIKSGGATAAQASY